jgi:5-formyltetrahydrofolate cyclo-ligase
MKEKLRKKIFTIRKSISDSEVLEKSRMIEKRLFSMAEFEKSSTILFYISYGKEVYTHEMIKKCISEKNIAIPVTNIKERRLILSKLDNWADLTIGPYGILEPKKEKIRKIPTKDLDLIVIPGVGFDEKGNRLGHGKGYYDNILNDTKALKIAIAFEFQIFENIPTQKQDVSMDKIITEKRLINCKKSK